MREYYVLFQIPNGGKENYKREMIRYLYLINSNTIKIEVADYILLNTLINLLNRVDG
jgi:hypothetical protein